LFRLIIDSSSVAAITAIARDPLAHCHFVTTLKMGLVSAKVWVRK